MLLQSTLYIINLSFVIVRPCILLVLNDVGAFDQHQYSFTLPVILTDKTNSVSDSRDNLASLWTPARCRSKIGTNLGAGSFNLLASTRSTNDLYTVRRGSLTKYNDSHLSPSAVTVLPPRTTLGLSRLWPTHWRKILPNRRYQHGHAMLPAEDSRKLPADVSCRSPSYAAHQNI